MGQLGRKFPDCGKALPGLTCWATMAMAILLAGNGACAYTQTTAPASRTAAPAAASQPSTPASATDIVGTWQGTLRIPKTDQHPQIDLRLIFKISRTDAGALKAVWYSIDQGGQPSPIANVNFQDGVLKFTVTVVPRSYEGKMSEDGKSIAGTWMEDKTPIVLPLERANADTAWAIPEPPKAMPADAKPKYDVVTVKPSDPNRPGKLFTIRGRQVLTINTTVNDLITFAYSLQTKEILNAPSWMDEKYDVDGVPDVEGQPNIQQMRMLMQDALVERFGLKFHTEQRDMSAYALSIGKGGPKLTVTADKPSSPGNFIFRGLGKLMVTNSTMKDFCHGMQEAVMDKPVLDQTGLIERYDFNLDWAPDQSQFASFGVRIPPPNPDDPNPLPSLFTALQEQLGLKMEATKGNVDVMVIDHIEKPSAN
jgi:uncharacterized protein (TIGR03435 family)